MKISIFEIESWEHAAFAPLQAEHEVRFDERPLDADSVGDHADAEIVATFIYSEPTAEVLARLDNLRLIATRSTGFDHIDLDMCRERGIKVANVPSYGENTVAEHVFGLLLSISHHMVEAADRTRRGDFSLKGLQGFDLYGKTMGIVGTGNIGRHAARIARGFGMDVLAYDVAPEPALADEFGFTYVALDELLARADVVSLHVPATEGTHHLIDEAAFSRMKDGAVLINTARGSVVKVGALIEALANGKLAAAGLDVLPEEPVIREEAELLRSVFHKEHDLETLLADHILLRLRNVVITPHSAFNTREAIERILETTRENIEGFIAGRPVNIVTDE